MNSDQKKYELAWKSFKFYNKQLFEKENEHIKLVEDIQDFFKENNFPSRKRKQPLKRKYRKSAATLIALYGKLLQELNTLIKLQENKSLDLEVEINEEDPLGTDVMMMKELSRVTTILCEEMKIESHQFLEIFNYEE